MAKDAAAHVIFHPSFPTQVFSGRMHAAGTWFRIEVDSAEDVQVPMQDGTAFGLASRVRIRDGETKQMFVIIEVGHLPRVAEIDKVKEWLPKRAIMVAASVIGKGQAIPTTGILWVAPADYSKDPQREDTGLFRRRCRFDVLQVFEMSLSSNPPTSFCDYAVLANAETHTRMYTRADITDAIQYWEERGFVTLLNRARDVQIKQTRDEDINNELNKYSWDEARSGVSPRPAQVADQYERGHYDLFISHASEDKKAVVVPLTNELTRRGLKIWVDYRELTLGDRLRARIDEGLRLSRFGLVIVSPTFFAKEWPIAELDGLVALEMADGRKRILPIWHNLDYAEVAGRSPTLAMRLAAKWDQGLEKVASEIMRAISD